MICLVTYSHTKGNYSGFGNVAMRVGGYANLSLDDIRAIEAELRALENFSSVVVLNLIPLPGGADA